MDSQDFDWLNVRHFDEGVWNIWKLKVGGELGNEFKWWLMMKNPGEMMELKMNLESRSSDVLLNTSCSSPRQSKAHCT